MSPTATRQYDRPMRRRHLAALAVAAAAAVAVGVLLLRDGGGASAGAAPSAAAVQAGLEPCRTLVHEVAMQGCYLDALRELVEPAADPREAVGEIADVAWGAPSAWLLPNCHGLMHTVGREYAAQHHVLLATLMDYLPLSNDPACPAGFAHGLISGVAPQLDPTKPEQTAAICNRAATRYQRYSCVHGFGHAFMRLLGERLHPALQLCTALGPVAAPDCAQGVYHDYWFSISGYDSTRAASPKPVTDPARLCAVQPAEFVKACWYRAFLGTRPAGFTLGTVEQMEKLCAGTAGAQRDACLTAASVVGPADPGEQLGICTGLHGADAVSCIHGTKVQNLLKYPVSAHLDVIRRCDLFPGATRLACYRWLGTTLAVITNGAFRRTGCPQLAADAARACVAGALAMNGPLVTFS